MQNEFKKRILEYLVGDYTIDSAGTTVSIDEEEILNSEIYSTLSELEYCSIKGRITDYDNRYLVVYGTYGANSYYGGQGFILMADFNFNVIELFTTYEGGTSLPNVLYMNTAEDGSFYAITADTNGVSSLTMFNNFTITLTGTYGVKFKQSYQLNGNLQNANAYSIKVAKKIGSANYIFVAPYSSSSSAITSVIMSTVQINVGSENTWTHTIYNVNIEYYSSGSINGTNGFTTFISWVGDDYYIKIGGVNNGKYIEYKATNGGALTTYTSTFDAFKLSLVGSGGAIMPSYDTTYVGIITNQTNIYSGDDFNIYKINNNNETLLYSKPSGNTGSDTNYFIINLTNNYIFFANYCTANNDATLGLIDGNNVYEIGNCDSITQYTLIYSTNQFNMNNIYIDNLSANVEKKILIYNTNNYNGEDYQALNSMKSNSGVLYDGNDKIIFARNIYNRIINANITESIIEVPNNYLNDTTIVTEELYSETNSLLNQETDQINKNIYETVYINFFNTLNMSNENDPNNIIINQTGASRLNQSISNTNNYNDVKIGKIKINYSDNTNNVITSYGLTKNSTTSYTISFALYVNKAISSIQYLSADGNTVYQEINPTLTIGKLYNISQDVKIV